MSNAYPAADALMNFLEASAKALRDAPARVEAFPDPKVAGRTGYLISGARLSVQSAIHILMESVDAALGGKSGSARFTDPVRDGTEWVSVGWVTVEQGR